jgi:hypothetical protein
MPKLAVAPLTSADGTPPGRYYQYTLWQNLFVWAQSRLPEGKELLVQVGDASREPGSILTLI